jgi:copper(I)-binding protein
VEPTQQYPLIVQSSSVRTLLGLVFVTALTAGALAQEKKVAASSGWVKTPAAGETQAPAFVSIENPGMYEVNVTAASADAAAKVELRDGSKAVTFINVPAFGSVEMTSAGGHLHLIGLKRPLKEGDTVTLTLSTDVDVTLTVQASVRKE